MKTKTKKKINNPQNKAFYNINEESIDLVDINSELLELTQNRTIPKENLSVKDCIKKLNYLSNIKIQKKYNCTPEKYERFIVEYLLNNIDCHLVSIFKEKMLTDYVDEFLRREYNIGESIERIPKFSIYYKNYLLFFCKPTYNNFKFNELIQNYGEKKAELYYKDHYQGGLSNDDEDNGFEESSSSDDSSNKENEYEFSNNNGEIFNKIVKEKLDNVTVMTTINTTGNNTINLNLNNEKIEVFSENKAEISNDTTINDLMEDIKKETKKLKNKKRDSIKKKFKNSYKKIMNYSLKNQDNTFKEHKFNKNLSIESQQRIGFKDISKKNILYKDKKIMKKDKERDRLINNEKIMTQRMNSQIFKYNVESHKINKNIKNKNSQNKMQKIFKKNNSKNSYNYIYSSNNLNSNYNKDSQLNMKNTCSNIKSPNYKLNKKNSISGLSSKKSSYRSRNNFGSLYKHITGGTNSTTNKNINYNFQTTHFNKNSLSNLVNNAFKTMNFMQTAHHQRTNSQLIKKQNAINKNKSQPSNISQEKRTSSLKMLVTDTEHPLNGKPTIKINKNDKLKNRYSNININKINNNKNIIINNNENNLNNKITVTTNNYFNNLNNRYTSRNNYNYKKTFVNSHDNISVSNQNYSNLGNQLSSNQLLFNNDESENTHRNLMSNNYQTKSNSNLMQIALSLLIENSSPRKQNNSKNSLKLNTNNSSATLNTLNSNYIMKNNLINQKNNKQSYNNLNTATHYNININNQINININKNNNNINKKGNQIKNKTNNNKLNIIATQRKNLSKKTINNTNSKNKLMNIVGLENNKVKVRTRNYNVSLKNGFTQNFNSNGRNNKILKGYHTKSVSNLTELINHNKKLISLYNGISKSKSKEKK